MVTIYKDLICKIAYESSCDRIEKAVMDRIERSELARLRVRTGAFGFFSLIAIIALIPAASFLIDQYNMSSIGQFISLAFSDSRYVIENFSSYALSIGDSMPLLGIMISLAVSIALVISLDRATYYYSSLSLHRARLWNRAS